MSKDDEIIESLIASGIISATLGALLSKNKEEGISLGALISAAILGTFKANEKATKTQVPMVLVENGKLFRINADGTRQFLRDLEKSSVKLHEHFKLK
jgi:uncharacterized membrane protein (UPF0136 family)